MMRGIVRNSSCFLISLMVLCMGCAGLSRPLAPTRELSEYPIQRADFLASVDDIWTATLRAVKASDGVTIMEDRDSSRITCSILHKPTRQWIQLNVLLKALRPRIGEERTAVFLGILARKSVDYSKIANDFFENLNTYLTHRIRE